MPASAEDHVSTRFLPFLQEKFVHQWQLPEHQKDIRQKDVGEREKYIPPAERAGLTAVFGQVEIVSDVQGLLPLARKNGVLFRPVQELARGGEGEGCRGSSSLRGEAVALRARRRQRV